MKRRILSASAQRLPGLLGALGLLLGPSPSSSALEERVEDLSASVEIASVFRLTLDKPQLTFHNVTPDQPTILGKDRWFNEIHGRSNSGRPWFPNAQVIGLRHISGGSELPPSALQWKVVEMTGSGEIIGGRSEFQPFAEQSTVIYASRGLDDHGQEVILRLQYSLAVPSDALAGSYVGQIVFTMAENP